jgi:ElaB/YqjD/DUF883 family membrane-anchored ribosome-binding protein
MIRIARHESSKNGSGRSPIGPGSGVCVDASQKEPSQSVHFIERFVTKRPGFCLGVALSVGIALGWCVKRS